jgi:hypothetical protein
MYASWTIPYLIVFDDILVIPKKSDEPERAEAGIELAMGARGSGRRSAYSTILSKSFREARRAGEKITISSDDANASAAANIAILRASVCAV